MFTSFYPFDNIQKFCFKVLYGLFYLMIHYVHISQFFFTSIILFCYNFSILNGFKLILLCWNIFKASYVPSYNIKFFVVNYLYVSANFCHFIFLVNE